MSVFDKSEEGRKKEAEQRAEEARKFEESQKKAKFEENHCIFCRKEVEQDFPCVLPALSGEKLTACARCSSICNQLLLQERRAIDLDNKK